MSSLKVTIRGPSTFFLLMQMSLIAVPLPLHQRAEGAEPETPLSQKNPGKFNESGANVCSD